MFQAGAKVGLVDKDGRNSLMLAALFGRMQLTELFLKAVDFNLNKVSKDVYLAIKKTALIQNFQMHQEMV